MTIENVGSCCPPDDPIPAVEGRVTCRRHQQRVLDAAAWLQHTCAELRFELEGTTGQVSPKLNGRCPLGNSVERGTGQDLTQSEDGVKSSSLLQLGLFFLSVYSGDSVLVTPWTNPELEAACQELEEGMEELWHWTNTTQRKTESRGCLHHWIEGRRQTSGESPPHDSLDALHLVEDCRATSLNPRGLGFSLVGTLAPTLLSSLRRILMEVKSQNRDNLEGVTSGYNPEVSPHRAVAARQVAWLVRRLGPPDVVPLVPEVLPLVLAALADVSSWVRRYGCWAMAHLCSVCTPADLQWQRALIIHRAKELVSHGSDEFWPLLCETAILMVGGVEGVPLPRPWAFHRRPNPRAEGLHLIMGECLVVVERRCDSREHWLSAVEVLLLLLPVLGLTTVLYLPQLMPLLRSWSQTEDLACLQGVLAVLRQVVRNTWPRLASHLPVILDQVNDIQERVSRSAQLGPLTREVEDLVQLLGAFQPKGDPNIGCKG